MGHGDKAWAPPAGRTEGGKPGQDHSINCPKQRAKPGCGWLAFWFELQLGELTDLDRADYWVGIEDMGPRDLLLHTVVGDSSGSGTRRAEIIVIQLSAFELSFTMRKWVWIFGLIFDVDQELRSMRNA